jgi:hypothetical protein
LQVIFKVSSNVNIWVKEFFWNFDELQIFVVFAVEASEDNHAVPCDSGSMLPSAFDTAGLVPGSDDC